MDEINNINKLQQEKYILYNNQVWKRDKLKKIKKRITDWKYKNIHKIRDIVSSLKKIKNDLTYLDVMIDHLDTISESDCNEIIYNFEEFARISNILSNKTKEKKIKKEEFSEENSSLLKDELVLPSAPLAEENKSITPPPSYDEHHYNHMMMHGNLITPNRIPPRAIPIIIG